MKNIYVIDADNRKKVDWDGPDARSPDNEVITRPRIDQYFLFLRERYNQLLEYIKDKEKKKLWIIGGSYAVFSLVTTVIVHIFTRKSTSIQELFSAPSVILFSLFIIGVVLIYTSIIKYVMALKSDSILAKRQLNCLRQSINSVVFSYLEKKYPKGLPQEEKELTEEEIKDTILDKTTKYWEYHGKHDKYPLDNFSFRSAYESGTIYFKSVDIYSVLMMGVFASLLMMTPFVFLLANVYEGNIQLEAIDAFILGGVSIVSLLIFILLVGGTVVGEMKRIRMYLKPGQPFG